MTVPYKPKTNIPDLKQNESRVEFLAMCAVSDSYSIFRPFVFSKLKKMKRSTQNEDNYSTLE